MSIALEHVSKSFGSVRVVNDVSLEIDPGELVALLGPSGGGKSTVLRIIAGLETPDTGDVWLDGVKANGMHTQERRVGFVFQHYALFRHMTVAANVGFGLEVRKVEPKTRMHRVEELLELVGLHGLGHRYPSQLSGGQRQRVALARALAPEPRLLLLDEPFGAVDAKIREELRVWLRQLHDRIGATTLLVTHDREEAFAVADRVVIIRDGRVEQEGTPLEVLDDPATEFVAGFMGEVNHLEASPASGALWVGPVKLPVSSEEFGQTARVVVRSYDVKIWVDTPGIAVVERVVPLGDRVRVETTLDGDIPLFAHFPRRSSLLRGVQPGVRVAVEVTHARAWTTD
jgi:sulfate transport system ATP-binding protein